MKLITFIIVLILLSTGNYYIIIHPYEKRDEPRADNQINSISQEIAGLRQNLDLSEITTGYFSENLGQWNDDFLYIATTCFGQIGFGKRCIYYDLRYHQDLMRFKEENPGESKCSLNELPNSEIIGCVVKLTFEQSDAVAPMGIEPLQSTNNFFLCSEPSNWVTGVNNYRKLVYKDLWPGIDVIYYFNLEGIKYDIKLHPGADPELIKIGVEGHTALKVNEEKNCLEINTQLGIPIIDHGLSIFYADDTEDVIPGCFKIVNGNTYAFKLDDFNNSRPVIIDPMLYSTFVGGMSVDKASDIAVDSTGNVYVTGYTYSQDFPVTSGAYDHSINGDLSDIVVFKFNPSGSFLQYSTYIGGSDSDYSTAITIDENGNTYITGGTCSDDFPISGASFDRVFNSDNSSHDDVIIFKLDSSGSMILFSTYLGGNSYEVGRDIAIDSNGNVYVTGETISTNFPTTSSAYDVYFNGNNYITFISKLSPEGSNLIYSTFLGGKNDDRSFGIVVDNNGNAYITGSTYSPDFPITAGVYDNAFNTDNYRDVFVTKIGPGGSWLSYSTFVGGSGEEIGYSIALDSKSCVYVTGWTESMDFPISKSAYDSSYGGGRDIFVFKLNALGSKLDYSTYVGGINKDEAHAIDVNECGNAFCTGTTSSENFPTDSDSFDSTYNEKEDAFIFQLNSSGAALVYSSYMGGKSYDRGAGIGVDNDGNAYVVGDTKSSTFPTSNNAYDIFHNEDYDIFVSKFQLPIPPGAPLDLTMNSGDSFVHIRWSGPVDSGGTNIIGYKICRGNHSGIYTDNFTIENTDGFNDTMVSNGETYYYRIGAINKVGVGILSKEVIATPVSRPQPPQNVTSQIGDCCINLSWVIVDNGGLPILQYNIYRSSFSGRHKFLDSISGSEGYYLDTNVTNGELYYYSVSAINAKGESFPSDEIDTTPLGPPSPPQKLGVTIRSNYIELHWKEPVDSGGVSVKLYLIYKGSSPDVKELLTSIDARSTSYRDTRVEIGDTYYYYVTAVNDAGESNPSKNLTVKMKKPETIDPVFLIIVVLIILIILLIIVFLIVRRRKLKRIQKDFFRSNQGSTQPPLPPTSGYRTTRPSQQPEQYSSNQYQEVYPKPYPRRQPDYSYQPQQPHHYEQPIHYGVYTEEPAFEPQHQYQPPQYYESEEHYPSQYREPEQYTPPSQRQGFPTRRPSARQYHRGPSISQAQHQYPHRRPSPEYGPIEFKRPRAQYQTSPTSRQYDHPQNDEFVVWEDDQHYPSQTQRRSPTKQYDRDEELMRY